MKNAQDFGDRLEHFIIEVLGISKNEFCMKTGISPGNLTRMINADEEGKKVKPGQEKLEAILIAYPNVSMDWLVGGKGHPVKGQDTVTSINSTPTDYQDVQQELEKARIEIREKDKQLEEKERTIGILQSVLRSKGFRDDEPTLKKQGSNWFSLHSSAIAG